MKLVIVGGVAGGAGAAVRARRLDEEAEIVVIERGEFVSFANCGLPYYAGNVIEQREDLLVQTVAGLRKRFAIDIRVKHLALSIHPADRRVEVKKLDDGATYRESYDYLILSPGAEPVIPPVPGAELPCVHRVRTIPDIDKIKEALDSGRVNRAVIIGGGYIGLEMAENISERGIETSIIEQQDQLMPPLDKELASILFRYLKKYGVRLYLQAGVTEIIPSAGGCIVRTSAEAEHPADLVVMSVGVRPESGLAREAGLTIGAHGGILTDSRMRTSDDRIYAVGDAVETIDPVTGRYRPVALAGPAAKQARVAVNNIFGVEDDYGGTYGTAVVKVFDLTVAMTGASEKALEEANIPRSRVYVIPLNHAEYYPDAIPMTIKLIFSPRDGTILGAQVVGGAGVDKRIDVLAAALSQSLSVEDLAKLELAYAPPFSSSKDPVNQAGMAALNQLQGLEHYSQWDGLSDEEFLLDVRTPREVARGAVPRAMNIPLDELRDRIAALPRDAQIAVFCRQGYRSYIACRILTQKGFNASNISGGYLMYRNFRDAGMLKSSLR